MRENEGERREKARSHLDGASWEAVKQRQPLVVLLLNCTYMPLRLVLLP